MLFRKISASRRKWKIKGRQNINLLSRFGEGGWCSESLVGSLALNLHHRRMAPARAIWSRRTRTKCSRMKRFNKLYSNKLTVKVFYDFLSGRICDEFLVPFRPMMEDDLGMRRRATWKMLNNHHNVFRCSPKEVLIFDENSAFSQRKTFRLENFSSSPKRNFVKCSLPGNWLVMGSDSFSLLLRPCCCVGWVKMILEIPAQQLIKKSCERFLFK